MIKSIAEDFKDLRKPSIEEEKKKTKWRNMIYIFEEMRYLNIKERFSKKTKGFLVSMENSSLRIILSV